MPHWLPVMEATGAAGLPKLWHPSMFLELQHNVRHWCRLQDEQGLQATVELQQLLRFLCLSEIKNVLLMFLIHTWK